MAVQERPVTGQSAVAEADACRQDGGDGRAGYGVVRPRDEDDLDAPDLGGRRGRRAGRVEVGQRQRVHAVDDRLRAAARVATQDGTGQPPRHPLAVGGDHAVAVEVLLQRDGIGRGHRDRVEAAAAAPALCWVSARATPKAHARWPSSSSVKAAAATSPNVTSATRSSARLTRAASSPTPPASMPSDRYGDQLATSMPRRWNPTAPAVAVAAVPVAAVPVAVVASGTFMSCTVCPGPNSIPVVSGSGVVVRAATQSGPVMVESVCVSVPASVGMPALAVPDVVAVVLGVVVVPVAVVAVGVVTAAAVPPARLMAAPHVAAVPVFVTSASVTISVCPAGTVNAVTAVVPDGTSRVISTMLSTTGVAVVVDDVALGLVMVCADTPAATR